VAHEVFYLCAKQIALKHLPHQRMPHDAPWSTKSQALAKRFENALVAFAVQFLITFQSPRLIEGAKIK